MTKKVIIVGGGIAGPCTGCYARMNGYSSTIFEMHDKPGGLCTSWKRKNYVIDGCIHWLVGSAPRHQMYRFWEEMGAVQGRRMVDHEEYGRIEGRNGEVFILYDATTCSWVTCLNDLTRTFQELTSKTPLLL